MRHRRKKQSITVDLPKPTEQQLEPLMELLAEALARKFLREQGIDSGKQVA